MQVKINLLEMMARKNIRQIKELHELTGISEVVISGILKGKRKGLQLNTIARLCSALDCEIHELITLEKDGQAS